MLQYLSGHSRQKKFGPHLSESFLFYLHYRVTFLLLMACCIAVLFSFIVAVPIVCTSALDVSHKMTSAYCWSDSTYSIASAYGKKVGEEVEYPGIGTPKDQSDYIYYYYYQWIYLVLFVQGVLFYIPHGLWKAMGAGTIEQLFKSIMNPPPICPACKENGVEEAKEMSHNDELHAGAVFFYKRWDWYDKYALGYWFCEILSWLNVIFQVRFLDFLFQGEFIPLGKQTMEYFESQHFDDNPFLRVFPRITKCQFNKFGSSGKVETADVLCVLTTNALTEKICLFLWFWLFALFAMSTVGIVLTFLTITCPKVRGMRLSLRMASKRFSSSNEVVSLAYDVGQSCSYGDWFVLSVLAGNMDIIDFKQFLAYLKDEHLMYIGRKNALKRFKEWCNRDLDSIFFPEGEW